MELYEKLITALTDNWPLVVGIGFAVYLLYRFGTWILRSYRSAKTWVVHVVDERLPAAVKSTLQNGGGDIIRKIVRDENAEQSKVTDAKIDKHAQEERQVLQDLVDDMFARLNRQRRRKGR